MNKAGLVAVAPTALLLAGLLILLVYHQTTDYFRKREIAHVIGMLPGDEEAVVLAGETRLLRRDFRLAALHSMGSYDALPDVIVEMVDRGRVQELASRLGIAATDVDVEMSIREKLGWCRNSTSPEDCVNPTAQLGVTLREYLNATREEIRRELSLKNVRQARTPTVGAPTAIYPTLSYGGPCDLPDDRYLAAIREARTKVDVAWLDPALKDIYDQAIEDPCKNELHPGKCADDCPTDTPGWGFSQVYLPGSNTSR